MRHDYGKDFENRIDLLASRAQLLLVRHGTQARYLPGGRCVAVTSDLDFRISNRHGEMAFFDAKSFAGAFFTPSQITRHQVERALLYQSMQLRAGFMVELREARTIIWVTAEKVRAYAGQRITAEHGVRLGTATQIDFNPLFRSPRADADHPPSDLSRGP